MQNSHDDNWVPVAKINDVVADRKAAKPWRKIIPPGTARGKHDKRGAAYFANTLNYLASRGGIVAANVIRNSLQVQLRT